MCTICNIARRYQNRQFEINALLTTDQLTRTVFLQSSPLDRPKPSLSANLSKELVPGIKER